MNGHMDAVTTGSVAGVSAPAFVERIWAKSARLSASSVAGVSAPAFVERCAPLRENTACLSVSPGSRLRPSLSDLMRITLSVMPTHVSPGSRLRPSLSEKGRGVCKLTKKTCRRGLGSGLR